MSLQVNKVVKLDVLKKVSPLYRVVYIDKFRNAIFLINMEGRLKKPIAYDLKYFKKELKDNKHQVIKFDEPKHMLVNEQLIPKKYKKMRDDSWRILKPIIENSFHDVFFNTGKKSPILSRAKELGINHNKVYREFYRYLKYGQTKNALLPHYAYVGNKGQDKKAGKKKRGRPHKFNEHSKKSSGVNVRPKDLKLFEAALNLFSSEQKAFSYSYVYNRMIDNFYNCGVKEQYGDIVYKHLPADKRPSLRQFRYWSKKLLNITDLNKKLYHPTKYKSDLKGLLGKSRDGVDGPGHRYEIDATIADIFLVSSFDPSRQLVIGCPVVYLVVDVWSRMIVGFYVGLEGPSYEGASYAIFNACQDKVEFCERYGVTIKEQDWPCHHIPHEIMADRGELVFKGKNGLFEHVGIKSVAFSEPYRGDEKGLVESKFGSLDRKFIQFIPGAKFPKIRTRADKRVELDAVLTLDEFTKILILMIFSHNNNDEKDDILEREMVEEKIQPIPVDAWNWGLKNRTPSTKHVPEEQLIVHLLPCAEASVRRDGIYFNKRIYMNKRAINEKWHDKARQAGRWKVPIHYTNSSSNYIWMINEVNNQPEICYLADHQDAYKDRRLEELELYFYMESENKFQREGKRINAECNVLGVIDDTVKNAQAIKKDGRKIIPLNKSQRLNNVGANRRLEKSIRRKEKIEEIVKPSEKISPIKIENTDRKKDLIFDMFNSDTGNND